jgi:hypothetical protein
MREKVYSSPLNAPYRALARSKLSAPPSRSSTREGRFEKLV